MNDVYDVNLNFKVDSNFSGYLLNKIEVISTMDEFANWLMDVVLDSRGYGNEASSLFKNLCDLITEMLNNKIKMRVRFGVGTRNLGMQRIAIVSADNSSTIYPSIFNMSSGELSLLCVFGELIKQADKLGKNIRDVEGIVLIDEIDKHLHIKLQKETLPKLIKYFPKVQFIVSSHAPYFSLGIYNETDISKKIIDLDNGGIETDISKTNIFAESYDIFIKENERFKDKYELVKKQNEKASIPIVITEGKTDWKHIKHAKEVLNIENMDIEYLEYDVDMGDTQLAQIYSNISMLPLKRKYIFVFDRDNFSEMEKGKFKMLFKNIRDQEFLNEYENLYAFAIPRVNTDEYGENISIEHYYHKNDLLKHNKNSKRLFLGSEFYPSGKSKDGMYNTKCKGFDKAIKCNGIIGEKVFRLNDGEERESMVLSKSDFVDLVCNDSNFSKDFDYSEFNKIFIIIRKILEK